MDQAVQLSDLAPGSAFVMPWRGDRNIGELVDIGAGSVGVRVPKSKEGEAAATWDFERWAASTRVIPTTREALNTQVIGSTNRAKSAAESPVELVHRLCSEMKGKTRDEIVTACVAQGVNINTARTQYYAWRKIQR
jgi:hypothetical protein